MYPDFAAIRAGIRSGSIQFLGRGAGRLVYDMGDGYVVKIARNRFGLIQNRNEHWLNARYKGDLLARIVAVSNGYGMLVMQAAQPLHDIQPVLDYFHVKTRNDLSEVPELVDLVKKHHLVMREFIGFRNWGLMDGRPVIIDYGFVKRRRRWP